ncbi:MAG TPA: GNAT family N-acetyltransferase [Acidimicrobiia bacterium]|nr:GNAT family N-acetyltransferase [Acidimicrobiia bacterium]
MSAVRVARSDDAATIARLHATRITEGFLPTLGARFLTRLYRRVARSSRAFAVVATDESGAVVGFAAATTDLGALYREFVVRDGVVAGALAAPRLVRSWRKVVETLRYPAAIGALPDAEILAVAVDPALAGTGIGSRLVGAATDELARRGVTAVKVVAGADNVAALRLYERCGFTARERVAVHHGVASEVLVWPSS